VLTFPPGLDRTDLAVVDELEANHVTQFQGNGDQAPANFAAMMTFEEGRTGATRPGSGPPRSRPSC
jgi:hypothetical protein